MKAGRESADFFFDVEHVGLDVDFYHPQGRTLKLSDSIIEAFESDREDADIFVQNSSGTGFSCDEMLSWFLLQTRTNLSAHLPQHVLEKGDGQVLLTVPIRFERGAFHMNTEQGDVDLAALKLMCKVTLRRLNS